MKAISVLLKAKKFNSVGQFWDFLPSPLKNLTIIPENSKTLILSPNKPRLKFKKIIKYFQIAPKIFKISLISNFPIISIPFNPCVAV